jgi:hypothetical protein
MSTISIELLNHASALVTANGISILSDPWLGGTCLRGGWGLRYENPSAWERAYSATHVWVSHFHGDHLHFPTLKQISDKAPGMEALANDSYNFDMGKALAKAGFKKIIPLRERKPIALGGGVEIERYPSSAIDNMLVIKANGLTVLNLNDCNLPLRALKTLAQKIGPIDVLMANYNLAGQWLEDDSLEGIKQKFRHRFQQVVETVNPKWVVPFASHQLYRSPASVSLNATMMTFQEIAASCAQVVPLDLGMTAVFQSGKPPEIKPAPIPCTLSTLGPMTLGPSIPWSDLCKAAETFRSKLNREFFGAGVFNPPVRVLVEDLSRVLEIRLGTGIAEAAASSPAHIAAHSTAILDWFTTPFGTDVFTGGAHYRIPNARELAPFKRLLLFGMLQDNLLSLRRCLKMMLSPGGWGFLYHRREELLAIARIGKLRAAQFREEDNVREIAS